MDTRSFVILATNQSMVIEHIAKLNKRAQKLSLPEITLTCGKAFLQRRDIKGSQHDVLVIPVDVSGPLNVKYDGYTFLATLQHLPTGENIIRTISNNDWIVPPEYHNSGSQCQHCSVKRYRKDTYVVVRESDGKTYQVGSSCIKLFLGDNSPDDILKRATLVAELLDFMNNSTHGGGIGINNEGIFHIEVFLAQTVAVIRDYGWISKSDAKLSGKKSTAAWVHDNFDPPYDQGFKFSVITDSEKIKAHQAMEWVENISDEECERSDYYHNIRAIARSGMVGLRTMGFAASIINSYDRHLLKVQPRLISSYVGVVRMREEFDLTLKNIYSGRSEYGDFFKYTFHDDRGNVIVWTTSTKQDLEMHHKYKIRGTVKSHEEYKQIKQTNINRCSIEMYYE